MNDRDLLAFISDLQLRCGKDHIASDLTLHALDQLRKGEITEKYCSEIIKTFLRPYPDLLERFSIIVEGPPPPCTRTGCIGSDEPFINTSIEFELWPSSLGSFLRKSRRALLHQCTMDDVFVLLEHINEQTSGPFWLLWDLYKPILPSCSFIQAIYDGFIDRSTIPIALEMPLTPSQSDKDPTSGVPYTIFDSDIFCCYYSDCRPTTRPLGLLRHYSYGLLERKDVNVFCSGRTPLDFSVLNDRWATNASGSEGQFQPAQKNQYENKLFDMEDERITLDVRICRLNNTVSKLTKLLDNIKNHSVVLCPETFPHGILNSLDILSLRELYDTYLPTLLKKIVEQPIDMIPIIISRTSEKIIILKEVRRNKESDYHDLNKKNYPKSLEVRHEEKQPQQQAIQAPIPTNLSFELSYPEEPSKYTAELILKTYKLSNNNNKESIMSSVIEYILTVLNLAKPTPLSRHLRFTLYPSNTTIDKRGDQCVYMSIDLISLFQLFSKIVSIVEKVISIQPSSKNDIDDNNNDDNLNNDNVIQNKSNDFLSNDSGKRGIQLAVAIGNVSESIFQPSSTQETISDALTNYIISGKHNSSLESLFEMPSTLPPGSLENLKKTVHLFIKTAINTYSDDSNQLYIDAFKCNDEKMYRAICLEKLSSQTYYTANLTEKESSNGEKRKVVSFKTFIPRVARMTHSLKLFYTPEIGPALLDESAHDEQQIKILTGRYSTTAKLARRPTSGRQGFSDLKFRLSSNEIQFSNFAQTVMLRK